MPASNGRATTRCGPNEGCRDGPISGADPVDVPFWPLLKSRISSGSRDRLLTAPRAPDISPLAEAYPADRLKYLKQ